MGVTVLNVDLNVIIASPVLPITRRQRAHLRAALQNLPDKLYAGAFRRLRRGETTYCFVGWLSHFAQARGWCDDQGWHDRPDEVYGLNNVWRLMQAYGGSPGLWLGTIDENDRCPEKDRAAHMKEIGLEIYRRSATRKAADVNPVT